MLNLILWICWLPMGYLGYRLIKNLWLRDEPHTWTVGVKAWFLMLICGGPFYLVSAFVLWLFVHPKMKERAN